MREWDSFAPPNRVCHRHDAISPELQFALRFANSRLLAPSPLRSESMSVRRGLSAVAAMTAIFWSSAPLMNARGLAPTDFRKSQIPISVQLASQNPTTPLEGTVRFGLRVSGAIGAFKNLEVRVVAHPRIETLKQLDATTSSEDLGGITDAVEIPFAGLKRASNGDLQVRVRLQDADEEFDFTRLNISTPGVYPTELLIRDDSGTELARTVTWLIITEQRPVRSVHLAWLWTMTPAPQLEPDGATPTGTFLEATHENTPMTEFVDRVAASPLPLSLVISPQALEAWAKAAETDPLAAITFARASAAFSDTRHELLPSSYVPIHGPALESADLGAVGAVSFADGAQSLYSTIGRRPTSTTVATGPLNSAWLDRLGETSAYQAIVDPESVVQPVPDSQFTLKGDRRTFSAIAIRSDLEELLQGPWPNESASSDALAGHRVQRWFAGLALLTADADMPIPIVLTTEHTDLIDAELQSALETALATQSLVDVVPATELFSSSQLGEERSLARATSGPKTISALEYLGAERMLNSFVNFAGDNYPAVTAQRANLRLAISADLSADHIRSLFAELGTAVTKFVAGIGVEAKRVTLTERRSSIPLSFFNNTDTEVRVRVTLASKKLVFPDGPSKLIVLPPGRITQAGFNVEARVSGSFTLTATITSADGNIAVGAPTLMTVNSAVFGSIGSWLTFGALSFLGLWWAQHFWRSRQERKSAS